MIEINQYCQNQQNIWNEFVKNSKNGTFLLNRDYMDYHSDRFIDHSLMFYQEKELVALLPANLRDEVLYSHQGLTYGGFIINNKMKASLMLDIFGELIKYLQKNNIRKLVYKAIPYIYHNQPSEEDLYALFKNNASLSRRDIATTIYINKKLGFSKSKKCGLSKARQNNLIVKRSYDWKSFMEIEEITLQKHSARPVHNIEEIKLLANNFPDNIKLFASFKEESMVAGIIIFENKNITHTQYMANSKIGMEIGGLDIIIWYLLEEEYKNKKYFDFGISTEQQGKYLNEGLINQKEMFGGRAICYDHYELNI